jgi:hypothetical protein
VQLALLQTPQLKFIDARLDSQPVDGGIEIAMLDLQLDQTALDVFGIHAKEAGRQERTRMTCLRRMLAAAPVRSGEASTPAKSLI